MVCPVCFIELPASGVCDEHGAAVKKTALPSVSAPEKPLTVAPPKAGKTDSLDAFFREVRTYLNGLGLERVRLEWDRGQNRLGSTKFRLGVPVTITLSRPRFTHMSDKERWNTVTHEAAHALAPYGAGHGPEWQRKHRELGGDGRRCSDVEIPMSQYKWVGTCPNGHQIGRHQKSKKMTLSSCVKCSPEWSAQYMFKWRQNF